MVPSLDDVPALQAAGKTAEGDLANLIDDSKKNKENDLGKFVYSQTSLNCLGASL